MWPDSGRLLYCYALVEKPANSVCKGPDGKCFLLHMSHTVSVTTAQFCHCIMKAAMNNIETNGCGLSSNKTLFIKSFVKVAQSRPTLCNPMDYTIRAILQARILECVASPFSRGSSQPRNWTGVSCIAGGFFTLWATREAPLGRAKFGLQNLPITILGDIKFIPYLTLFIWIIISSFFHHSYYFRINHNWKSGNQGWGRKKRSRWCRRCFFWAKTKQRKAKDNGDRPWTALYTSEG